MKSCFALLTAIALSTIDLAAAAQAQSSLSELAGDTPAAPVRRDVARDDDTERLLLLTPRGPLVLEISIRVDGEPFRAARERLVDRLISEEQSAGRALDRGQARAMLARRSGGDAFFIPRNAYLATLYNVEGRGKQLFARLVDRDADGVLQSEEISAAADALRSGDANDDETLDALELGLDPKPPSLTIFT